MSFSIGKKAVLTDLVLNLDASNRISYPGIGGSWYDISGYGNHFTLTGTPTWTGKAFTFNENGGNHYAQCINNTCGNFGTDSFTIEYVVSMPTSTATNGSSCLISKRSTYVVIGGAGEGYRGWMERNTNGFFVQDNNPDGFTNDYAGIINLTATPYDNTLYHIVQTVKRNGTQATGSQYKNGVLNGAIDTVDFAAGVAGDGIISNTSYWQIFAGAAGGYTTGSMYLMRAYSRALTAAEVQTNYQSIRSKLGI